MERIFRSVGRDLSRILSVILAVSAIAGIMGLHVSNGYQITAVGYEIAAVTQEHRSLIEENKKLRLEAAVQGRTERVKTVAEERYGLRPLQPEQIRAIQWEAFDLVNHEAQRTEHASL